MPPSASASTTKSRPAWVRFAKQFRAELERLILGNIEIKPRIARARYSQQTSPLPHVDRYQGYDPNQLRDQRGRWTKDGVASTLSEPRPAIASIPSHAATPVPGVDHEGRRLLGEFSDLWKTIPHSGPDGRVHRASPLKPDEERAFLKLSREEQRQLVAGLRKQLEDTVCPAGRQTWVNPDGEIGAASPRLVPLPLAPSDDAPYSERLKYYMTMRDHALRTGNARYLVNPPRGASDYMYYQHARDIGELTGDWSYWAASRMAKGEELLALWGSMGARQPLISPWPGIHQETAHGAPLAPPLGPNVTDPGGARPPAGFGQGPFSPSTPAAPPPKSNIPSTQTAPPPTTSLPSWAVRKRSVPPAPGITQRPQSQLPNPNARQSAISIAKQKAGYPPTGRDPFSRPVFDPTTGELIGEESIDGKRSWKVEGSEVVWWNTEPRTNERSTVASKPAPAIAGIIPIQASASNSPQDELTSPGSTGRFSSNKSSGRAVSGSSPPKPTFDDTRTPGDNQTLRDSEGKRDFSKVEYDQWLSELPTRSPQSTRQGEYQRKHAGDVERQVAGGGKQFYTDGIDDSKILETKLLVNPRRSPFIAGSGIPDFVRSEIVADVESEFSKMATILKDPANPLKSVEVIVSDERAIPFFESLLKKYDVPGHVVVKPE